MIRMVARAVLPLTGLLIAGPAAAQTGLLVVAHGAGIEWNARVRQTVSQVHWSRGPVVLAFLMGEEAQRAGWDAAVDTLLARGARAIIVVPFMVSSYGGHYRQIEYYAGVRSTPEGHEHDAPSLRHRPPPVPTRVTPAIDAAPELGAAIAAHWEALAAADRGRPALLVAHGPSDSADAERWIANIRQAVTAPLRGAGLRWDPRIRLLQDDAPPPVRAAAVAAMRDTIRTLAAAAGDSIVVLPVLVSTGDIDRVKIPRDLEGLPVRYLPASLAPRPELARWIERVGGEQISRP